ncbi:MAG: glycosyltransferase family 4 protein [Candidatus Sericytochromatia bacterium]|nr:glycosyltransferase family 4 protein [Candidatus Sericytochromatia bacterium]
MAARVALISEFYPPVHGGQEEAAQRLALTLAGLGVQVSVYTLELRPGPPGPSQGIDATGLSVTRVRPEPDRPYQRSLADAVRAAGPFDGLLTIFLTSFGAETVQLARGWDVPAVLCGRGRDVASDVHQWQMAPSILAAVAQATAVAGVSQEMCAQLAAMRPNGRDGSVWYWPNTVDLGAFRPCPGNPVTRRRVGLPGTGPLIGFAGMIRPIKGMHELLEGFRLLLAERPDAWLVLIGGLRGDAVEAALRAWAQRHPQTAERLIVRPYVPQRDLPELLGCLDQVWYPSLSEGLSNSLLQALACEVPLVATAVGGTPDVIVDGENGLLVPVGEAPPLARAALKLLTAPAWARELARRGRTGLPAAFQQPAERMRLAAGLSSLGLLSGGAV